MRASGHLRLRRFRYMTCRPAVPVAPIRRFTLFSSRVFCNCSAATLLRSRCLPVSLCGSSRSPKHLFLVSHGYARLYCLAHGFLSRRTQVRFSDTYFRTGSLRRFIYRATREAGKHLQKGVLLLVAVGIEAGEKLDSSPGAGGAHRSLAVRRCRYFFACHIKGRNPVEPRPCKSPGGQIKK